MKKVIETSNAPAPIGPYNQAVLAGNTLFVSGQIPYDGAMNYAGDDISDQAHQVMKNLRAVLEAAGMNFDHVAKTSIFLKSMDDFNAVNEVYGSYIGEDAPARETVEVSRLPKDVKVEISMIALKS
ncbi:MAG TPA: reactive intermediate/imine deaminase [Bacteroidetes bacterium]|nr:reactive intermediate/imine deaminase [Bacteroidota bacterium]